VPPLSSPLGPPAPSSLTLFFLAVNNPLQLGRIGMALNRRSLTFETLGKCEEPRLHWLQFRVCFGSPTLSFRPQWVHPVVTLSPPPPLRRIPVVRYKRYAGTRALVPHGPVTAHRWVLSSASSAFFLSASSWPALMPKTRAESLRSGANGGRLRLVKRQSGSVQ